MILLLAVAQQAWAYDVKVECNGVTTNVSAVTVQDGTTYTIGNYYNAAISEYTEGALVIPRITATDTDVNVVGRFAFRLCTGITKIVIEEGIDSIGSYAFLGCSGVKTIELPASLKSVARGAFVGLVNLESITCKGSIAPTWATADVFNYLGTASSLTDDARKRVLYVPNGALESYNTTKCNDVGWKEAFWRIYEVGQNTAETDAEIATAQDLFDFAKAINSNTLYKGKRCTSAHLTADIDLMYDDWIPIGNSEHPFTGTFNGNGHVIKDLYYNDTSSNGVEVGLFGRVDNATIYNLRLLDPQICANNKVGSIVGHAQSVCKIYDILVQSSVHGGYSLTAKCSDGTDVYLGGLVGYAENNCIIESCMFEGELLGSDAGDNHIGGIVGATLNSATIRNCYTAKSITDKKSGVNVGGIVGTASGTTIENCLVRNIINYTAQDGQKKRPGLIIGTHGSANTIRNCACYDQGGLAYTSEGSDHEDVVNYQEGNKTWSNQGDMTQEATMNVLGTDGWYYFNGGYIDWPIPYALEAMYNKDLEITDENGLVYLPIEANKDQRTDRHRPTTYQVIDYTGNAESVTIPWNFRSAYVLGIVDYAFYKNTTLKHINAPYVKYVGKMAFYGSSIKTAKMPYLSKIGTSAFEDCDSLLSFETGLFMDSIQSNAFSNCDNLTNFTIYNLKHDEGNFLKNCPKLTSLTISGNEYGYFSKDNVLMRNVNGQSFVIACASGKTGQFTIPVSDLTNTEVVIEDECFAYCPNLTGIIFPAGKTYKLDSCVFSNSENLSYIDLTKATFKDNVTYTVDRLKEKDNPFYQLSLNTLVYLPKGHKAESHEPNIIIMNEGQTAGTAHYLLLDEDVDFSPKVPITAENGVFFSREVEYWNEKKNGGYYPQGFTSYLPYDLTLSSETTKVYSPKTIETVKGVTFVTFAEVEDKKMKAYTPYFLMAAGDHTIDFSVEEKITIGTKPSEQGSAIGGFVFMGTTESIPNSGLYDSKRPVYLYQVNGKWLKVPENDPTAYTKPFRAYFKAEGSSQASTLSTLLDGGQLAHSWDGDGTETSPYLIKSADHLKELSEAFNKFDVTVKDKYFRQAANIEFDKTVENNYTPINDFYGNYDGAGYTISGLNLNSSADNEALFLEILSGTVKNVIIKNSYFHGNRVGAIAASVNEVSTVENCHVLKDVTIEPASNEGGGIVGLLKGEKATVTGCTSQAVMKGTEALGGIIGTVSAGTVSNCIYVGNSLTSDTGAAKALVGTFTAPDAVKKENLYFTCTTLADPYAALMPDYKAVNIEFLRLLAERDEFLLNEHSGLTKEQIGYDITLNNRPVRATKKADGTWQSWTYSICLPYDLDLAKLDNAADIKIYKLHEVDMVDKVLQFTNEFPLIEAGVPCIVVIDKGEIFLEAKNTTIVATPKEPIAINTADGSKQVGWWTGTFKRIENDVMYDKKVYIMQAGKVFGTPSYTTNDAFTNPFVSYFSAMEYLGITTFQSKFIATENGAESGDVTDFPADEFENAGELGEPTGISPVIETIDADGTRRYYDLNGRQLAEKPRKGLYINNGKLMFNK